MLSNWGNKQHNYSFPLIVFLLFLASIPVFNFTSNECKLTQIYYETNYYVFIYLFINL